MPESLALLTGAAGGIGQELARRLVARGHTVLAVARTHEQAEAAAAGIGPGVRPVACDLSDRASVAELVRRIEDEWAPSLDLVVCNAGVVVPGHAADLHSDDLHRQVDVMLAAAMQIIAASARAMRVKRSGHILATVSTGGILALPGSAAYSAAKAGLRAYLAAVSAELRGTGVAVSGVYPSAVDTPMLVHEATHDGSLLNFVGRVSTTRQVGDLFERALRSRRLELYLPYSDSLTCRFLAAFPWILPPLLPALEQIGSRGRARYLAARDR